jgi:hypothetical protein
MHFFRCVALVFCLIAGSLGARAEGLLWPHPTATKQPWVINLDGLLGLGTLQFVYPVTSYIDARRPAARAPGAPLPSYRLVDQNSPFNVVHNFPEVEVQVTSEEVLADGRIIWRGRPQGQTGFVNLVINGNRIAGHARIGDRVFDIRYAQAAYLLNEVSRNRLPPEDAPMRPPATSQAAMVAPATGPSHAASDGNTTINVLVAYGESGDPADITSDAHLMAANANAVFENSGIPVRVKVVGATRLDDYTRTYEGASTFGQLLTDITDPHDGKLDSIHALRSSLQADLVVLLTEKTESCGRSWQYDGRPEYGFAVVNRACAITNLSFEHSIGHLTGAERDRDSGDGASANAYNFGYVDTTARIRTVMASDKACLLQGFSCLRVPYFSSPHLTYNGRPLGVDAWSTSAAFNVRRLTETAASVAQFRNGTAASFAPVSGWWWNPSEPGRGYSMEFRNGTLFFAAYTYAADGSAIWYVSSGAMSGPTRYAGPLQEYRGGPSLSSDQHQASFVGSAGTLALDFTSASEGQITFPNGSSTTISRFDFVTNGAVGGPAPGYPQAGWWWNADEAGRGYFIEAQNNAIFVSFYMYNDAGQATWYVASGHMVSPTLFSGALQEYAGGSALEASFRAPDANAARGPVSLQFSGSGTAILTLPTGAQVPLTRFAF